MCCLASCHSRIQELASPHPDQTQSQSFPEEIAEAKVQPHNCTPSTRKDRNQEETLADDIELIFTSENRFGGEYCGSGKPQACNL